MHAPYHYLLVSDPTLYTYICAADRASSEFGDILRTYKDADLGDVDTTYLRRLFGLVDDIAFAFWVLYAKCPEYLRESRANFKESYRGLLADYLSVFDHYLRSYCICLCEVSKYEAIRKAMIAM